jgi:hypothetical protein
MTTNKFNYTHLYNPPTGAHEKQDVSCTPPSNHPSITHLTSLHLSEVEVITNIFSITRGSKDVTNEQN